MEKIEKGKYIISAAKSLKSFRLGDPHIAALLYATSHAGRAGLFISALRHNLNMSMERLSLLAAEEGFGMPELRQVLLPWLEENGLIHIKKKSEGNISVDSIVLTYSGLLSKVSDLFDSLDPTPEEIGCLSIVKQTSHIPTTESEVLQKVAREIGEVKAKTAISLVKNYKIIAYKVGKGLKEPILYSEKVWSRNIENVAKALTYLDKTKRDTIINFVDQVKQYQGLPEILLRRQARGENMESLLNMAIDLGLLNKTDIDMADGTRRPFLTSPHFYADLEEEFGEDMCDRVKIFLDSIRNGQHYGHPRTGRIFSPDLILRKLLNVGELGPCTAIGTDYVTSEKAGIIRVRREDISSGKCFMELVQKDTVTKVHEVVTTGIISPVTEMQPSHVREGVRFYSVEQVRAEAGDVPPNIAEAERAIILKLRES